MPESVAEHRQECDGPSGNVPLAEEVDFYCNEQPGCDSHSSGLSAAQGVAVPRQVRQEHPAPFVQLSSLACVSQVSRVPVQLICAPLQVQPFASLQARAVSSASHAVPVPKQGAFHVQPARSQTCCPWSASQALATPAQAPAFHAHPGTRAHAA
jgi:hypothetical protein